MILMYIIQIYFLHTAYIYNGPSFYQKLQDNVICTTKTRRFQKNVVDLVVSKMVMWVQPAMRVQRRFGNMVRHLTLTIANVQPVKCQSKLKKESLTTGHDHGRIRKNRFDPLFLICGCLLGFASVLKVFVTHNLVAGSYLNSGFVALFQVFSVVTSLGNKPAKTKIEQSIREFWKPTVGSGFIFAGPLAFSWTPQITWTRCGILCGTQPLHLIYHRALLTSQNWQIGVRSFWSTTSFCQRTRYRRTNPHIRIR